MIASCQLVQYFVFLTCLIDFNDCNPLVKVIKAPWPQNRLFSSKNSDWPDDQNIYRYIIQGSCLVQPWIFFPWAWAVSECHQARFLALIWEVGIETDSDTMRSRNSAPMNNSLRYQVGGLTKIPPNNIPLHPLPGAHRAFKWVLRLSH